MIPDRAVGADQSDRFVFVVDEKNTVRQKVITLGRIIDGLRIRLSMPSPIGGRGQLLTFEFLDASTGQPVSDLEPYLGAVGHLLLVSADLQDVAHSHPVADMSAAVGPAVVFQVLFPRSTVYRFWIQVQRRGRVIVAPFTVAVRPRDPVRE